MEPLGNFLLLLIRQFAGGPGPAENNLVRFGLSAILWFVLLIIAWGRQKNENVAREKMLVWGFGFAMLRELIMFGLTTNKITGFLGPGSDDMLYYPLEHGLSMASIVVVAGAFLQYAVKNETLANRYIHIGLVLTVFSLLVSYSTWPQMAQRSPGIHFNETWESLLIHIFSVLLLAAAILILMRRRNWLRISVSIALGSLFFSEVFFLFSNAVNQSTNSFLCPIGNLLHIVAIPIFGYVYLKEMSIEKKTAEDKLAEYREHLEDLVGERTSMLVAQNEIANSLSRSLDLETILNLALDKVLAVLSMEVGLLFLLNREKDGVSLGSYRGLLSSTDLEICIREGCPYEKVSLEAIKQGTVVFIPTDKTLSGFTHIRREKIKALISVPLISKDRIIGALTLGSKSSANLDQTNLELLTAICHQIGLAIENAYLYHEVEVWANELSTLHQASLKLGATLDPQQIYTEIARQTAKLSGCLMACVVFWKESDEVIKILSSTGLPAEKAALICDEPDLYDLLREVISNKATIVISDVHSDARVPESWKQNLGIHSLICTPIWGVEPSGEYLFIMDTRQTKAWYPKDVELIESFISRAAVALENAHLYKQLEWAAALEERQRISADMHDGLAQVISLLGLKIDNISELLPERAGSQVTAAIAEARQAVDQAMVEARKSISSLQSLPAPQQSLQDILAAVSERSLNEWPAGDRVAFESIVSKPLFLPSDQIAQVVPIIQEAIINARKHSDAENITITLDQESHQIKIVIADNGKGFSLEKITQQNDNHFGVKIMQARAARLGGELQIDSMPGKGTTVTLTWIWGPAQEVKSSRLHQETQVQGQNIMESESYV